MSDLQETDWAEKIGKPCYENLAEMVAALECDYDRLEELRECMKDRYDELSDAEEGREQTSFEHFLASMIAEGDDVVEEVKELEDAAKTCGNECSDREDAERMIHEDPLSVEVRSDWTTPGEEMTAGQFQILLSTGGPATRIMGELDEHGEPYRAWLEVQDWFKPWTEYHVYGGMETLLTYARCFTYGN
jgi:hypothetical protein